MILEDIIDVKDEETERIIEETIERLSINSDSNGTFTRETPYKNREYVRQRIEEYIKFFTITRNINITEPSSVIKLSEVLKQLSRYNFKKKIPTMKKIEDIFNTLDKIDFIGPEVANILFKGFPNIVYENVEKLKRKLEIINSFGYMSSIIEMPKKLMTSPEVIYARLAYYSDMITQGKERRRLIDIPASELLGDKDTYTEGEGKKISIKRKNEIISTYQLPTNPTGNSVGGARGED